MSRKLLLLVLIVLASCSDDDEECNCYRIIEHYENNELVRVQEFPDPVCDDLNYDARDEDGNGSVSKIVCP